MLGAGGPSASVPCGAFSHCYSIAYAGASCGSSVSSGFPFRLSFSSIANLEYGAWIKQSDASDFLVFSDSAYTVQVPSEVEFYDGAGGSGEFWFKGTCNNSTPVTYYVGIGNSSPPARTPNPWDADYKGVWHFPNGTTLGLTDSSGNVADLVNNSGNVQAAPGQIDGAASYDGNDATWLHQTYAGLPATLTVSAWVNCAAVTAITIMEDRRVSPNKWTLANQTPVFTVVQSNGTSKNSATSAALALNTWHYVVGVADGSHVLIYKDGAAQGSPTAYDGTIATGASPELDIGQGSATKRNWFGSIDEARISDIARGPDWIKAEFNNQNAPGNIGVAAFWAWTLIQ